MPIKKVKTEHQEKFQLIAADVLEAESKHYENRFLKLKDFKFTKYHSSQYARMAQDIHATYFSK